MRCSPRTEWSVRRPYTATAPAMDIGALRQRESVRNYLVRTELNRALSNVQPSIGLPLDGQGEPLYNLVYRPYDELESILVPHLGSPRVYPSTPAMAAFIDGAVRHVVEERPVELSDGLLRRHDGELLSEYVRRLLA